MKDDTGRRRGQVPCSPSQPTRPPNESREISAKAHVFLVLGTVLPEAREIDIANNRVLL